METNCTCCCIIGDIFVDVQANGVSRLPTWNSDTGASSIEVLPGGSAANTARQLHALVKSNVKRNIDVKFISTIGNDYFGKFFKDVCDKEELKYHFEELDCPTSVCMCLSGPLDRAFVSCYSSTDAFQYKHIESEIPENIAHIHIGGYFNLIGLHTHEFVKGCGILKAKGVTISISTQYDAREKWTGENDILQDVFPLCDIVFVNEQEMEKLLPVLKGHEAIVIETRGANGSRVHPKGVMLRTKKPSADDADCGITDSQQPINGNAFPIDVPLESHVPNIVDATGAGDAFIAGFLDKWMSRPLDKRNKAINVDCKERSVEEVGLVDCCRRGHRVAGLNVQRLGACRHPLSVHDVDNDEG